MDKKILIILETINNYVFIGYREYLLTYPIEFFEDKMYLLKVNTYDCFQSLGISQAGDSGA